jgi:hypothetical protein
MFKYPHTLFIIDKMAKFGGAGDVEGSVALGTEAWNVAEGYTKLKILRLMIQIDRYDTIAQFGTEEMGDDFNMDDTTIARKRIEAFQRFTSILKQLIGNVKFAIKKDQKVTIRGLEERLENVENIMNDIYAEEEDQISHIQTIVINEKLFMSGLKILQQIKEDLNIPMNKAGLIFRESDEVDIDKIMNEIVQGG